DLASVATDDALDGRQSDPGSFELVLLVKPLKYAEQLVGVLHVEADSIVSNADDHGVIVAIRAADLDFGVWPSSGELDAVGQEIHQYHTKHRAVAVDHRQSGETPDDVTSLAVH